MSDVLGPVEGANNIAVVVTAAGSGSRLGYGAPKALVPLSHGGQLADDSSILAVALRHVAQLDGIAEIVVTAPADDIEACQTLVERLVAAVPVSVVEGGASRQESVFQGLKELERHGFGTGAKDVVLVHDAARALAPTAMMQRVANAVNETKHAVIPTLEVTDTLKQVASSPDDTEHVVGSVDRSSMRTVQTPQGFVWSTLWRAHQEFAARGLDEKHAATDDSTIAQWAGEIVWCVSGDDLAAKVTTPRDLAVARVLYAEQNGK